jgi:hypothetical protein
MNTQKNNSRSKTSRNKKQVSKSRYRLGKFIIMFLFILIIALLIYFILDWALDLAQKRYIESSESPEALIISIEQNDSERSLYIYNKIIENDLLKDDFITELKDTVNTKFTDFFTEEAVSGNDAYDVMMIFNSYLDDDNVVSVISSLYEIYRSTGRSYETFQSTLESINDLDTERFNDTVILYLGKGAVINDSRESYRDAEKEFEASNLLTAYELYMSVSSDDLYLYDSAKDKCSSIKTSLVQNLLDTARTFESEGDIENAFYTMKSVPEILIDDPQIIEYTEYINDLYESYLESNYVEYKGIVYNIFFHSLILYPDIAFSSSRGAEFFNVMATKEEFVKTLNELYNSGYILIDTDDFYDTYTENGISYMKIKDKLMLPEGKKPLILSFDNMSCIYWSMGFCKKIVLDENGNLASLVMVDGVETTTYDGEHVLILEQFINEHPDFSYKDARAVIALSGIEGMFGYATDKIDSPDYQEQVAGAKRIADKLNSLGYDFACHSYYHYTSSNDIPSSYTDLEWIKYDTEQWKKYIEPILGATDIYVTPGGKNYSVDKYIDGDHNDPCYNYLVSAGFHLILSVGRSQAYTNNIIGVKDPMFFFGTSMYMDRFDIDGKSMYKTDVTLVQVFGFDVEKIIDPVRAYYKEILF